MDKNILKKFAIESRKDLMNKIENKVKSFYINEPFSAEQKGDIYVISNEKHSLSLTNEEYKKRELLIKRINELSLEQVIEEAAYTWFNRIIAIRYMEINDMLPLTKQNQSLGVRVLSSKDNTPDPEILKFTNLINPELDIDFRKEKFGELKNDNDKFKYILLLVCKKLGRVIPQVFDGVTDYIDILIPDNLLNDTGFITKLINEVPESNFNEVEIIGWLYQYYNQTEKDRVMSENRAYKKSEIAYVTQLFTPDWIVKYLVENTLLKYVSNNIQEEKLEGFKYYDRNAEVFNNSNVNIENVKFIDPCCGSGHILVYAFEVFYQIYINYGYNKNDIPRLILENNIYGIDIDDRAGQLSVLAILLKAREFDKNIFNKDITKQLNIISIQESNKISDALIDGITNENSKRIAKKLVNEFKNAKEIGSLLKIENDDYAELENYIENDNTIFGIELKERLVPIINAAKMLSKKYDLYVTNPPYMNNNGMTSNIKDYLKLHYKESKTDLYACFMNLNILKPNGLMGMINQHGWMFLSSFEQIREKVLNNYSIITMCHLGPRAFEEIGGEVVQTTAFVVKNSIEDIKGSYYRLVDFSNPKDKEIEYLKAINSDNSIHYMFDRTNFSKIPGEPVAYWVDKTIYDAFEKFTPLNKLVNMFQGIITGDNNKFLRLWWEVDKNKIAFDKEKFDFDTNKQKWIPYNKGGSFRKWYGNQDYVIDWKNGPNDKTRGKAGFGQFYLNEYISWSYITTSTLATRYFPNGFLWDVAGSGIFCNTNDLKYYQSIISSSMGIEILKIINPTMNYQVENVALLPIPNVDDKQKEEIIELVDENIKIAKYDWDSKENSWKFQKLPFLQNGNIEQNISNYHLIVEKNKEKLQENERKINNIINKLYNNDKSDNLEYEITYNDCETKTLVKELISYSVGCMFGRYSLDEDGVIYASGNFVIDEYKSYKVDADNIIPLTEDNYFGDDIVSRFKNFIEITYGKEFLYENLDFIAETLGKKNGENSEETIRRYFVNDFYNDHVKMYQKRPIYWLFDSGKKNGFKCLIYMHRYNEGIVSKIRLDYLHRMQNTYEKELKEIADKLNGDVDLTSKRELSKRQADISAKLQETNEYDEKISHIADQKIKIDLDDGVVVNYAKFSVKNPKTGKDESILAKIK